MDKKKRKLKRAILRRSMGILLVPAVAFNALPVNSFAMSVSGDMPSVEEISSIGELVAALPDKVTADNAEEVQAQLDKILGIYRELTGEEQEQIDISRCLELQAALDEANVPAVAEESAAYQEAAWNGSEVIYTPQNAENCILVDNTTVEWTDGGWYVVNGSVTIDQPITVNGAVNLILADDCTLNAEKGIVVTTGNSLAIYAQPGGTGTLNATGAADSGNNASAGIGGTGTAPDSGTITIHGGVINATGGGKAGYNSAAGIGGGSAGSGDGGSSGKITIYGGTITANSGAGNVGGAGIGGGGGYQGSGGTGSNITIYGGSVTAKSTGTQTGGAGIGGGSGNNNGGAGEEIKIYGGTVNAIGGVQGAGIGGGSGGNNDSTSGSGTDITISGGEVTAMGGQYAAGIGGGGGYQSVVAGMSLVINGGNGNNISISDSIVDASSPTDVYWADYKGDPIGNGGNTSGGTEESTFNDTIVFKNGVGTVYGNVILDKDYAVPGGYTLTIPDGAMLSGTGTLSGGGTFTTGSLTEDMISVPDIHYTSEDMAKEIEEKVTLGKTICGKMFEADVDGWTLGVKKVSGMEYTITYTHESKDVVSKKVTILPCLHGNNLDALTRHDKVEADCTQTGVKEYWDCSVCKKIFSDKDGQTEITEADIKIPAGHTLICYEKKDATCIQEGNKEYWGCSACDKKFSDKDGKTEITDIIIPVTAHTLTKYNMKDATCTQAGNTEYWGCSVCGKKFSDEGGQTEVTDTEIPVIAHTLIHHEKKEADCTQAGSKEYWECSVCGKKFSDKDGQTEITEADIEIPAGHDYNTAGNGNGTHTHSCKRPGCGFTETEDCSGGTASYTEKARCEICGGVYGELLKDGIAPAGEISIRANKWNSFLNTITFGLFFKKTEQVTITAQDNESGVASVSYYISDSGLAEEEVKNLDNWTDGNTDKTTFSISQNESCVVYAKITDKQGNVSYISSDGLSFDDIPPSITGVTDQKTYCTPQAVTVTDDNLESVTVNGQVQTLSDGKFTLGAASGAQTIEAYDKAGNITTVTVTVNTGHNYSTEWKTDSKNHWHECACGDKSGNAAHTEDSGSVTKEPTETEKGIRTYKCSVCGYVIRTEEINTLPAGTPVPTPAPTKQPQQTYYPYIPSQPQSGGNQTPGTSTAPAASQTPVASQTPAASAAPVASQAPDATQAPGTATEVKKDDSTGTVTEITTTKDNNITTVVEKTTLADGTENTKESVTEDSNGIIKIREVSSSNKANVTLAKNITKYTDGDIISMDAMLYTGKSETGSEYSAHNTILENFLNEAKEAGINNITLCIGGNIINDVKSNKNHRMVIRIIVPQVEGISVGKVLLSEEAIKSAVEENRKLVIKMFNENPAASYTVTIPPSELEKMQDGIDISIKAGNVLETGGSRQKNIENILSANSINAENAAIVSIASNNTEGGIKASAPVANAAIKAGGKVYVYRYNSSTGKLEEIANSQRTVLKNGMTGIEGYSGNDYVATNKELNGKNVVTLLGQSKVKFNKTSVKKGGKIKINTTLPEELKAETSLKNKVPYAKQAALVTYKSSNTKIAKVSKNGTVTATGKGKAVITVKIKLAGGKIKTVKKKITVQPSN